jgi:hypothetical protein
MPQGENKVGKLKDILIRLKTKREHKNGCTNNSIDILDEMNKRLDRAEKHVLGRAQLDDDDKICIFRQRPPTGGCER